VLTLRSSAVDASRTMSAAATLAPHGLRSSSLQRMGDESLASRAADGDDDAFSALYARYHGPLLGYTRSILLDAEDANDATQSALEKALRALPRRDPGRPLRPWLYRIAHNEAIDIVRRRQATADSGADLSELLTVPGPEVDAEQRTRLAQLIDDLRMLPERQRGALVMRELSGLSYDEIGDALGLSNDAARRAVFDARSALHEAADGRATACVSIRRRLSDGDRRYLRGRGLRAHLRACDDCASFEQAIGARQADLHMLGPWLGGASALGLIGLGGAGGGAALLAGGSGAGAGTVVSGGGLSWAGWPLALKGLAVGAVVATTGTAAIELPKAAHHAPQTHAGARVVKHAPVAIAQLREAVQAQAREQAAAVRRRHREQAEREAADLRVRTSTGRSASVATTKRRSEVQPITPAPSPAATATAPAPSTTPDPPAAQQPAGAAKTPRQLVVDELASAHDQTKAVVDSTRALATSATQAPLAIAKTVVQGTLGSVAPQLDDVLSSVGAELHKLLTRR
jgi:RNA polymerase sigma factor (sigma-70 family)